MNDGEIEVANDDEEAPALPTVGVIIPACGNAALLGSTIESVLGQVSDSSIVIAVICDGDVDSFNTARSLLQNANADVYGRLLRRRYGLAKCLNVGLDLLRGCDMVGVLEPGCLWTVGHIAAALTVRTDASAVYVPSTYNTVDSAGSIVSKKRSLGPVGSYLFDSDLSAALFDGHGGVCVPRFVQRLAAAGATLIETNERTYGACDSTAWPISDEIDPWDTSDVSPANRGGSAPEVVGSF